MDEEVLPELEVVLDEVELEVGLDVGAVLVLIGVGNVEAGRSCDGT